MTAQRDKTIDRSYQKRWQFLVEEYELVKAKKHPTYKTAQGLFKAHNMPRQSFYKYYGRFKHSGKPEDLLPQKRGAKWKTRRPDLHIEKEVIAKRKLGLNRYEIYIVLLPLLKQRTSGGY